MDANIPGENYLRNRAVSVQTVLDDLNDAQNALNVIVLDACRYRRLVISLPRFFDCAKPRPEHGGRSSCFYN